MRSGSRAAGLADWHRFPAPLAGFQEHCFLHDLPGGREGMAAMRADNRYVLG
ncbi:hypothetical protein [Victivallis sp. Marseille-Q1083]|uniref:hypothetical protein n=1 Tax=Victivallis sp. Marseille-Q1083 TaxID=2717288 RepID=UPI00158BCA0A|nr:hypothetical protein [Victivallis sp. Marseille-Q1083]